MEGTRPLSVDTVPETFPTEAVVKQPLTAHEYPQAHTASPPADVSMSSPTRFSTNCEPPTVEAPAPAPAPAAFKTIVVRPSPKDSSQAYVVSIQVPASHLAQFRVILQGPPDPSLVIPPRPPRRTHTHRKRKRSIVLSSTVRSVSSVPAPVKGYVMVPDASSSTLVTKSAMPHTPADPFDKDQETKMAELMQLKTLKTRQEDLCQLKDHIRQLSQTFEDKEAILDELRSERKQLQNELVHYANVVKQIQRDLELATAAEEQLARERDQLATNLSRIRDHDYDQLKQQVDGMRASVGLRPLPNLEQEREESIGRYLEERRGRWREQGDGSGIAQGTIGVASSSSSSSSTTTTTAAISTSAGAGPSTSAVGVVEETEPVATLVQTSNSRLRSHASRSRPGHSSRGSNVSGGRSSGNSGGRRDHEPEGRRRSKLSSSSTLPLSSQRHSRSRSPIRARRSEGPSTSSRRFKR